MRSYDINKRSVYALHRLGKGYPGEDILNNYELATTYDWKKNYSKIARTIHKAVKTVAGSCTSDAAKEIKTITWFLRSSQDPPFKVLSHSQKF